MDMKGFAKDFWDAVGPTVKHLTLDSVTFQANRYSTSKREGMWFLSSKLPNLESLSLDGAYIDEENRCAILPEELFPPPTTGELVLSKLSNINSRSTDLLGLKLSGLPNVQEIHLSGGFANFRYLLDNSSNDDDSDYDELGERDNNDDEIQVNSSVKHLDLGTSLHNRDSSRSMPVYLSSLEILKVSLSPSDMIGTKFITAHSQTLTKLETARWIASDPPANPISTEFPVLTELRLCGSVVSDLNFLRFTPNLQLLHMDLYCYEKQGQMQYRIEELSLNTVLSLATSEQLIGRVRESGLMMGVVLPTLEYCQRNCELGEDDIRTLAEWMPNLKTFKSVLDSPAFQQVCAQWKELECLECQLGSSITDADIVAPKGNGILKSGLTDLRALKSFGFMSDCFASTISDDCVEEGFLKMSQLTQLHISVSDKFSLDAEKFLREHIQKVTIIRHSEKDRDDGHSCSYTDYKYFIFNFPEPPPPPKNSLMDSFHYSRQRYNEYLEASPRARNMYY